MLHLNGLGGMCAVPLVHWASVRGIHEAVTEVNSLSCFESSQPHYQDPKDQRGCIPWQSEISCSYFHFSKKKKAYLFFFFPVWCCILEICLWSSLTHPWVYLWDSIFKSENNIKFLVSVWCQFTKALTFEEGCFINVTMQKKKIYEL